MKSPARKRACVEAARATDRSPSRVADIFLLHGGLQHFSTCELLSTFGCVGRRFRRHARDEFNDRLRRRHPSLVAAVGSGNIDSIGWREWRRFEMYEEESRESGECLEISMTSLLEDYDMLLEVTKHDHDGEGEVVVWHGVEPLTQGEGQLGCEFTLPHISLDVAKPLDEGGARVLGSLTGGLVGEQSLQARSIHMALNGIFLVRPPFLSVQVVMRRRSDGKMVTVLSAQRPNQIIGEDYGNVVGHHEPVYQNSTVLFEEADDEAGDKQVCSEINFNLYWLEVLDNVHASQDTFQFTSRTNEKSVSSTADESSATVYFRFYVMADGGESQFEENFVLQATRSWKWS